MEKKTQHMTNRSKKVLAGSSAVVGKIDKELKRRGKSIKPTQTPHVFKDIDKTMSHHQIIEEASQQLQDMIDGGILRAPFNDDDDESDLSDEVEERKEKRYVIPPCPPEVKRLAVKYAKGKLSPQMVQKFLKNRPKNAAIAAAARPDGDTKQKSQLTVGVDINGELHVEGYEQLTPDEKCLVPSLLKDVKFKVKKFMAEGERLLKEGKTEYTPEFKLRHFNTGESPFKRVSLYQLNKTQKKKPRAAELGEVILPNYEKLGYKLEEDDEEKPRKKANLTTSSKPATRGKPKAQQKEAILKANQSSTKPTKQQTLSKPTSQKAPSKPANQQKSSKTSTKVPSKTNNQQSSSNSTSQNTPSKITNQQTMSSTTNQKTLLPKSSKHTTSSKLVSLPTPSKPTGQQYLPKTTSQKVISKPTSQSSPSKPASKTTPVKPTSQSSSRKPSEQTAKKSIPTTPNAPKTAPKPANLNKKETSRPTPTPTNQSTTIQKSKPPSKTEITTTKSTLKKPTSKDSNTALTKISAPSKSTVPTKPPPKATTSKAASKEKLDKQVKKTSSASGKTASKESAKLPKGILNYSSNVIPEELLGDTSDSDDASLGPLDKGKTFSYY